MESIVLIYSKISLFYFCKFYADQGNSATGDYCSKCWRELQARDGNVPAAPATSVCVETTPMETISSPAVAPTEKESTPMKDAETPRKKTTKKKKKKTSYKSMMAAMTQGNNEHDIEKEKESLRKVTGGGTFSKIDKI